MSFRLLGKCPSCNAEDEIVRLPYDKDFSNYHKVRCGSCETIWGDWLALLSEESRRNNKLIPVEVEGRSNDVRLYWPSGNEVPFKGLIVAILNSALITKFNLDVCVATEGGVCGEVGKGLIELRNYHDEIGLYPEMGEKHAEKVFDFYEKMMRQLFEEPLSFGNANFRRGEILWLEENKENTSNALTYLFATLTKTASRKFAEKVLSTKEKIERNPFSAPYIRGLTNEEVAQFFVQPPVK